MTLEHTKKGGYHFCVAKGWLFPIIALTFASIPSFAIESPNSDLSSFLGISATVTSGIGLAYRHRFSDRIGIQVAGIGLPLFSSYGMELIFLNPGSRQYGFAGGSRFLRNGYASTTAGGGIGWEWMLSSAPTISFFFELGANFVVPTTKPGEPVIFPFPGLGFLIQL